MNERALRRIPFALLLILGGCAGPTGPQGPERTSWGSSDLVGYSGAPVNVSASNVGAALDELAPKAAAAVSLQASRRYCGFATNGGGGNFGGYGTTACDDAVVGCTNLVDRHPCSTEEMVESYLAGVPLTDTVWVYDPTGCEGLTVDTVGTGIRWSPSVGFTPLACNDISVDKLACCGRAP